MIKKSIKKIIALGIISTSILAINPIGASAKWKQDSKGWWYSEGDSYVKDKWELIDGNWYCFDYSGYMKTGFIKDIMKNKLYYSDSSGKMVTGWQKVGGISHYFYPSDGSMAYNTTIDGCYIDDNGIYIPNEKLSDKRIQGTWRSKDGKTTYKIDENNWNGTKYTILSNENNNMIVKTGTSVTSIKFKDDDTFTELYLNTSNYWYITGGSSEAARTYTKVK